MNKEEKAAKGCFYTLILAIVLSFVTNVFLMVLYQRGQSVVVERDTVWRDTTIYQPQPAETINTGRVVYVKVPTPATESRDTVHDSIEVPVPIVQKRYDDSLYTAWVSGYQPALDSIRLHQPTIVETITITNTITKQAPRLSVGIQGGAGVGMINRQADVWLGVGAQWRLWP